MFAIDISNLNYNYSNGKHVLRDFNLQVEAGDFFGLLGLNGAGKSTLINIMSSCIPSYEGSVKIMGMELRDNREKIKRLIGVVPQEIHFDPFFSVQKYLTFTAGYYGVRGDQGHIDKLIDNVGLGDKKDVNVRMLSGGMKRRLLVAKALVHNPEVIILDEPTAGVDIELRQEMWDYIKNIQEGGKTVILTTHYLEEAQQLCNNISVIHKGRPIYNDTKESIINNFASRKTTYITNASDKVLLQVITPAKGVEVIGNSIVVADNAVKPSEVVDNLSKSGVKVVDVKANKVTLDEAFSKLIEGEEQKSA